MKQKMKQKNKNENQQNSKNIANIALFLFLSLFSKLSKTNSIELIQKQRYSFLHSPSFHTHCSLHLWDE